jgi:hypothetical protein
VEFIEFRHNIQSRPDLLRGVSQTDLLMDAIQKIAANAGFRRISLIEDVDATLDELWRHIIAHPYVPTIPSPLRAKRTIGL